MNARGRLTEPRNSVCRWQRSRVVDAFGRRALPAVGDTEQLESRMRFLAGPAADQDSMAVRSPLPFTFASAVLSLLAACSPAPPDPAAAAAPASAGPRLYVTNEMSGDMTIIDVTTRRVIATVPLGKRPRGIRVSPDGTRLYIALSGSPIAPPGVDESRRRCTHSPG